MNKTESKSDISSDEQLASMIELGLKREMIKFDNLDDFEAYGIAKQALEQKEGWSGDCFNMPGKWSANIIEPVAMCGFLGDEENPSDESSDPDESDRFIR